MVHTTAHAQSPRRDTASEPQRPGQQNALARRLQALVAPTSPIEHDLPDTATAAPPLPRRPSPSAPRALKVRVLTWNMHDSIPKGDIGELLGIVGPYQPPALLDPQFPNLVAEASHPYHLVVVASQECPSPSGIPMGLGPGLGAGLGLKDREKDKEKEKSKDRDREHDRPRSRQNKDRDEKPRKSLEESLADSQTKAHAGWTSVIENWLCHGGGSLHPSNSLSVHDISNGDEIKTPPKALSTSDIPQHAALKETPRGPYQLLIKERMMGIYLAVYIHRDLRGLVRGTSKSAVTAGLLKGRVGNKGGVGISINIDGVTLLFINAHLAAHEGKVLHRLANFAKIKTELSVDAFLDNDDPRMMAEDLTDRFDYTFLCGDLNFRLDISRLHADWLISRQDYAQALGFDQLRKVMESGEGFVGFNEGPINFPPTFKYDVMRSLKNRKSRRSIRHWVHGAERKHRSPEAEDKSKDEEKDEKDDDDDDDGEEDEGGEATSVTSSVWTSLQSRANTTDVEDEGYFHKSHSSQAFNSPGNRLSLSHAAIKAKAKWIALVSPPSPGTPVTPAWLRPKEPEPRGHSRQKSTEMVIENPPYATYKPSSDPGSNNNANCLQVATPVVRAQSTRSSMHSDGEDEDEDKGVYDSSHKKRVPSWCDRILWKSTVQPDPESDELQEHMSTHKPRLRVSQFFHAFRPRSRKSSHSSISSVEPPPVPPKMINVIPSPSIGDKDEDALPFSRFLDTETSASPRLSPNLSYGLPETPLSANSLLTASTSYPSSPGEVPLDTPPPVPPKDYIQVHIPSSRWRLFPSLPGFLSREASSLSPQDRPLTPDSAAVLRKGDVVCLDYDTLDDRQMRRLQGRSDHRPVIGSYAVYI